jgi:transposase
MPVLAVCPYCWYWRCSWGPRSHPLRGNAYLNQVALKRLELTTGAVSVFPPQRVKQLEQMLREHVRDWYFAPVVSALQAMRGVRFINAVTLVAEIGDLTRFDSPRQLMCFLGLVPSQHSSGEHTRLGPITKSGNRHARRNLIEAAWAYRYKAKVSREIQIRQEHLSFKIREIAWKAQVRLCARYRKLYARGKNKNVVIVAIARELVAFMWDIAHHVHLKASH